MTDRALYVAMTGASASLRAQASVSHNLANADTVGFQATLDGTVAAPLAGDGAGTRVAARHQVLGTSDARGAIQQTGGTFDVALHADRWLAVQAADGGTAFTRAGDLRMTPNGLLTTATGLPVLGADGAPLAIPPHQSATVAADGTISIVPLGQAPNTVSEAGRLQLVSATQAELVRGADGLMRAAPGRELPRAQGDALVPGAVEGSNVDATAMLVSMIQHARQFEMQVRLLHGVDENARTANALLSPR
ncbi:flagellar basal-body rod protein FlgF [Luteimonas pelagia]